MIAATTSTFFTLEDLFISAFEGVLFYLGIGNNLQVLTNPTRDLEAKFLFNQSFFLEKIRKFHF